MLLTDLQLFCNLTYFIKKTLHMDFTLEAIFVCRTQITVVQWGVKKGPHFHTMKGHGRYWLERKVDVTRLNSICICPVSAFHLI